MAMAVNTATSVNIVGFTKVVMPPSNSFSLVALNFNQVGGSNQISFLDLFGTNQLRGGETILQCDKVAVFNPSEERYYRYAFKGADLAFHQIAPANRFTKESTNPVIMSGQGFWLVSGSEFPDTNYVTLAGEVVTISNTSVYIDPGFQMLGNQYTTDFVSRVYVACYL